MTSKFGIASGVVALAGGALISTGALAHTGIGAAAGFAHGFAHPFGGIDHILAMVAVGLFAVQLKGRALWLVPASFVGMMAVGGIFGVFGMPVPLVELGIALSVVTIGGLVALGRRLPVAVAMAIAGAFALFHGHAHGVEMPASASGLVYGLGFVLATVSLHGAGILAGFGIASLGGARGTKIARAGGAAMSVAGLTILVGIL